MSEVDFSHLEVPADFAKKKKKKKFTQDWT